MSDEPTLRDLFGIVALHAMLTSPRALNGPTGAPLFSHTDFASAAYVLADAMMVERAKDPQ